MISPLLTLGSFRHHSVLSLVVGIDKRQPGAGANHSGTMHSDALDHRSGDERIVLRIDFSPDLPSG
jgi:hypothetical protein